MESRRQTALALVLVAVTMAGCLGPQSAGAPGEPRVQSTTYGKAVTTIQTAGCGADFERTPSTVQNATTAKQVVLACETSRIVNPDQYVHRSANVLGHTDAGWYVRASVLIGTETGGTSGVYLVDSGDVTRIDPQGVPVDDYFHSSNHTENAALEAYLLNYGNRERDVRVTLTYLNASTPVEAFNRTYELSSESGAVVRPVTMRTGTYDLTLRAGGAEVASDQIVLRENASGPLVVVFERDGDVDWFRAGDSSS